MQSLTKVFTGKSARHVTHNLPLIAFAGTLFLSAALLFLIEPMFAKMVLPLLGGSPAVWNTCMVFFQAGLLAGYAYAHATVRRLGVRRQAELNIVVLFLGLLLLPVHIPASWSHPPVGHNPVPWLLMMLIVSVGLPFLVLSTIAPTLMAWYANTGLLDAEDPYFLYGASNLGSLLGLLSYPVLIEPHLHLLDQAWLWTYGYGLLLVLTLVCAIILWCAPANTAGDTTAQESLHSLRSSSIIDGSSISGLQRMRWVALAFVPSSLMLGVTTALTTDFPPVPLFWVIPLAIYLLTFILVFARKPKIKHELMIERLPFIILAAIFPVISKTEWSVWLVIAIELLTLFVASMVCHGELARSRPPTKHLTEFYLWMSLGGIAGGLFNAVVAPLVFDRVLEYPLALIFAALLRPSPSGYEQKANARTLDFVLPLALGVMLSGLIVGSHAVGLNPGDVLNFVMFAPAMVLCLSFGKRRLRFGLGVTALLFASTLYVGQYGQALYTERSFFGVYRVTTDADKRYHLLIHGSTVHGLQSIEPNRSREPLSYYSHTGPIGQVFTTLSGTDMMQHVAIIGLGTGSLATYGGTGQEFTFYEIDPAVERIARDARYFTFLRDSSAGINVVLGDARLSLRNAPEHRYGLIVLDAFSSDAIPIHLLTREAIRLYLAKLADHGLLAFNISNRYLDLRSVLADLAGDAGLFYAIGDDSNVSTADQKDGKNPSLWVVMSRQQVYVKQLVPGVAWKISSSRSRGKVWTDDFSNILGVIRWLN